MSGVLILIRDVRLTFQSHDPPYHRIDLSDIHIWIVFGDWIFRLVECDTGSDDDKDNSPEFKETAKRDKAVVEWDTPKLVSSSQPRKLPSQR